MTAPDRTAVVTHAPRRALITHAARVAEIAYPERGVPGVPQIAPDGAVAFGGTMITWFGRYVIWEP